VALLLSFGLKAAHPDDVLTMTRLTNRFVGADPGMLLGMR